MDIKDKIISSMMGLKNTILSTKEIEDLVIKKFPRTNRGSILPSDYCYNHKNHGSSIHEFFLKMGHAKYQFVGENYSYVGDINKTDANDGIRSRDTNIPNGITHDEILSAAKAYDDKSIPHEFSHSTTYDVIINGHRYPPKAIIGIASSYHLGSPLTPHHFSGGLQTKCFRVLRENGFQIVLKNENIVYPDEVPTDSKRTEGKVIEVTINYYERDPKARDLCIEHYGLNCQVCSFNFEEQFDDIGAGFIHVHHTKPLSEIKEEYKVDAVNDLIPVCPNCHAMLHKRKPIPYTIDELRKKLKKSVK